MTTILPGLALVAGYLVGSLSFAVIVSRAMGLNDPRSYGSGNPGATNVLRSGNRKAAILTLLFDAMKGFGPVVAARAWALHAGVGAPGGIDDGTVEWTAALAGFGAFLGHLWPLFFAFRGGKGVATAAGVLFGIAPWLGVATLATWAIVAAFSRYSSLASIAAAAFAPFYQLLIWGAEPATPAIYAMSALLVWRHAANIRKLLAGTESRLGQKAAGAVGEPVKPAKPSTARRQ